MRTTTISKGGQLSVPADVRHRWATRNVVIEDHGTTIVVRPIPDDPIGAAIRSLKAGRLTSERARAISRGDEAAAEGAKAARR